MTALTTYRDTKRMGDDVHPTIYSYPIADNVKIFKGSMVGINAAGQAIPASTSAVKVVGIAEASIDNTILGHVAAMFDVPVRAGTFKLVNGAGVDALTVADLGNPCYALDDQTLNRTSANGTRPYAGIVKKVEASGVYVQIDIGGEFNPALDIMLVAAADLRTSQYFIVKVDSAGKAALAAAGDAAVGVLQNAPNASEIAIVRVAGRTKIVTAATPAAGSLVASDAAGKAKAASLAVTNTSDAGGATDALLGSNVIAMLLATGVADTAVAAVIMHMGASPTTPG